MIKNHSKGKCNYYKIFYIILNEASKVQNYNHFSILD